MNNHKFRFWNPYDKAYRYASNLEAICFVGKTIENGKRVHIPLNRMIAEQWTGRVDRDNKEIYVGDIVTLWISDYPFASGRFEVKFHRGSYGLHAHVVDGLAGMFWPTGRHMTGWDYKTNEAIWTTDLITRWHDLSFDDGLFQVIGNIHENPELLNNK